MPPVESILATRLVNFSLSEAAGICEAIAAAPSNAARRPPSWWRAFATLARNYRTILASDRAADISQFMLGSAILEAGQDDLGEAAQRVVHETARWRDEVEGGEAYLAFLQGYTGFAELDARRGPMHLARALMLTDHLFPLSPELLGYVRFLEGSPDTGSGNDAPMSGYQALQTTADYLKGFFHLTDHPLTDIRRFALLPDVVADIAGIGRQGASR